MIYLWGLCHAFADVARNSWPIQAFFTPITQVSTPFLEKGSPVYRKTISGRLTISRKNGPSPCPRAFLVGANVVLSCWPSYSDPVEHDEPSRSAGMTLPEPRTRQSNIKGILLITRKKGSNFCCSSPAAGFCQQAGEEAWWGWWIYIQHDDDGIRHCQQQTGSCQSLFRDLTRKPFRHF